MRSQIAPEQEQMNTIKNKIIELVEKCHNMRKLALLLKLAEGLLEEEQLNREDRQQVRADQ